MKSKVCWLSLLIIAIAAFWLVGCDREESGVVTPVEMEQVDPQVVASPSDQDELNISAEEVNTAGRISYQEHVGEYGEKLSCISLNVPYFSQLDIQWKGLSLGFDYCGNSTIGKYGCHLTCLAMLYKKWGYSSMTPVVLNNWSYQGRAHYAFSTIECGDLIRLPQALQYGYMSRPYRYIYYNQIYNELAAGRPVVARISFVGVPSHYVVIYAFDGTKYLVRDPLGQSSRALYGTIRSLAVYGS